MSWLILTLLFGLGMAAAWHRAKPLQPIRNFLTLRCDKIYRGLEPYPILKITLGSPFWWIRGWSSCLECTTFYTGAAAGLILGPGPLGVPASLWWFVAGTSTFAAYLIVHRLLPPD